MRLWLSLPSCLFHTPLGFLLSGPHRLMIAPFLSVLFYLCLCVCVRFNHFASVFLHCTNGINWIEWVTAFIWIRLSVYFPEKKPGGLNSLCLPHKTENRSWQPCLWLGQTLQQTRPTCLRVGGLWGITFWPMHLCFTLFMWDFSLRGEKKWLLSYISAPSWEEVGRDMK